MIQLGHLAIRIDTWTQVAICLVLAGLTGAIWSAIRARRAGPLAILAFLARLVAILALGLVLARPVWISTQPAAGENLMAIVVDNSLSMSIHDHATGQTRGQLAKDLLKGDWLRMLQKGFAVRQYLFDTRCRPFTDLSELSFDVPASNLKACLDTIRRQYAGRPLAGVVLVTDGIATDADVDLDCTALAPIYPVLIGGQQHIQDIAITDVSVDQTAFEDAPVTVKVNVHASGLAGRSFSLSIYDPHGTQVASQSWQVGSDEQSRSFEFRLRPTDTGVVFYRLQATSSPHESALSEATTDNNHAYLVIERRANPYRVLYVSGRPNWEYKFLQRAAAQDPQIRLTALIRLARREPKYEFRGRPGQQTNPLYRGFEPNQPRPFEPYDRPVLVRLNIAEPNELLEGFPKTAKELFSYHGLILDDLEAAFLSNHQMELIRRFVSVRGGGLLMLGGKDSLSDGAYAGTPIDQVLPVGLEPLERYPEGPFSLELTAQGLLQPWLRLRTTEQSQRQVFAGMPRFQVLNPLTRTRPGSLVLLTGTGRDGRQWPVLITGRFGNGRSIVLTVGDIWRWGMQDPQSRSDMETFWRQIIRFLVAQSQDQVQLTAIADHKAGSAGIRLQARILDAEFQTVQSANVTIDIQDPNGRHLTLPASQVSQQPGLFEATFLPRSSGPYIATAHAVGPDGTTIGRAQTGWASNLEAKEFGKIQVNTPLLQAIASRTSGKVLRPKELGQLQDLAGKASSKTVTVLSPIWDLPWILPLLLLACLIGLLTEWTIRRTRGLP